MEMDGTRTAGAMLNRLPIFAALPAGPAGRNLRLVRDKNLLSPERTVVPALRRLRPPDPHAAVPAQIS